MNLLSGNRKKKRICMLAYAEYYTDARIKAYVNALLNKSNEYQIDVICLFDKYTQSSDNLNFYFISRKYQGDSVFLYLMNYFWFFIKATFIITYLSIKNKYKVIHVHNQPDFIIFCAMISKLTGAKLILDMHDIMIAAIVSKFKKDNKSLLFKLTKFQTKISVKFADALILADHSQRDYLKENNITYKNTHVFLNLPDEKLFTKRENFPNNEILTLIYHGTLSVRLGIDIMIKAVERASRFVNLSFTIIGNGEMKNELINYCRNQNILDSIVFFKNLLPVEDLQKEIERYDVGMIGNRKTVIAEKCMLPVKLMEYLAVGLPVIAPRLEVIQRYFDEGMLFYYEAENITELSEIIINMARDENFRLSKNVNSEKFFRTYNFETQYKKYINLINFSV